MSIQLFSARQHAITPYAQKFLEESEITTQSLLERHYQGDWAEMDAHDQNANTEALTEKLRIFSAYTIKEQKIWVITEADRSVTTILLPSEY